MSAFFLVQTTQQLKRVERKTKRVKRKVQNVESSDLTAKSITSTSTGVTSVTSSILNQYQRMPTNHSSSLKSLPFNTNQMIMYSDEAYRPYHEREKKCYDENTSSYKMKQVPLLPLEAKISKYEKEFLILKNFRFHQRNLKLNHEELFTVKNLNILRYTYFKELSNNYEAIQYRTSLYKYNGDYKLRYLRKIAAISISHTTKSGLPTLEVEREVSTDLESEDESDETVEFFVRPNQMSLSLNIRSILQQTQFWNTVYQDIKLYSIHSVNHYDQLPSMNQARSFFTEIVDYTLYHINQLTGDCSDLQTASDIQLAQAYMFTYFKDYDYDYFRLMKNVHNEMYSSNDPALFKLLVETVMENVKNSTAMVINRQNYDEVFAIWEKLFNYIIFDVLDKKDYHQFGDYNEMTTKAKEDGSIHDTSSQFDNMSISTRSPQENSPSRSVHDPMRSPHDTSLRATLNHDNISLRSPLFTQVDSSIRSALISQHENISMRSPLIMSSRYNSVALSVSSHTPFEYPAPSPDLLKITEVEEKKKKKLIWKFRKSEK